jgi:sulfide:quinone oxidoreductase
MEIRQINESVSVGAQISPNDVDELAKAGFKSIICNRPDDEIPGQATFADIASEATRHGMEARYVPVISGAMTMADVEQFSKALDEMAGPVFAYCRSGTRSTILWSLDQHSRGKPADQIIETAERAGYDVRAVLGV